MVCIAELLEQDEEDYEAAEHWYRQAVAVACDSRNKICDTVRAVDTGNLALCLKRKGALAEALAEYDRALGIAGRPRPGEWHVEGNLQALLEEMSHWSGTNHEYADTLGDRCAVPESSI